MNNISISQSSLSRLPKYLRIIEENQNEEYISASFIAQKLNLNKIQVRKDLAFVCSLEGKPGSGFKTEVIKRELEDFLGLKNTKNAVIVGAGKLGQALLNYPGFKDSLNILMAFDTDRRKCDNKKIFYINEMKKLISKNNVEVGIITVPEEYAQEVCVELINSGIKAIWNFAPVNLEVPDDIIIKNEDLMTSAIILLNKFKNNLE